MNSIKKHFSLLFLIVPPKLGLKAEKVFRLLNTPEQYFVFAKGTANSTIVDMLGLGEPDKTVTIVPLQTDLARKAVATLQNELYLGAPNTGIAFTVPINGGSLGILQLLSQNATAEEKQEEMNKLPPVPEKKVQETGMETRPVKTPEAGDGSAEVGKTKTRKVSFEDLE